MKSKIFILAIVVLFGLGSCTILTAENKGENGYIIVNELRMIADHLSEGHGKITHVLASRQTLITTNQQSIVQNQVKIMEVLNKILDSLEILEEKGNK
jgi:hypothetical protein